MHRKFIALIVSTAILITGMSVVPARADVDDTTKFLAGLAAIAIIGAAIKDARDDKNTVSRNHSPVRPRPLPLEFRKYDLPRSCLRQVEHAGGSERFLARRCLTKTYSHWDSLPDGCRSRFWKNGKRRVGYNPRCLRHHGYRITRQ